jgi:hypothetical protein
LVGRGLAEKLVMGTVAVRDDVRLTVAAIVSVRSGGLSGFYQGG